jgi:hypothetical protein
MFGSRLIFGSHFPFRVAQLRDARAREAGNGRFNAPPVQGMLVVLGRCY